MEAVMAKVEIRRKVATSFEKCEVCEYTGSFHVLLERVSAKRANNVKLRLKCPNCRQVYDVGLFATLK
jgi:uncharacterized protein with PIN domain